MPWFKARDGDKVCVVEGTEEAPGDIVECFKSEAEADARIKALGAGDEVSEAKPRMTRCKQCNKPSPDGTSTCPHCDRAKEPDGPDDEVSESAVGRVIEVIDEPGKPRGSRWEVVLIESGVSINGNYWDPKLLESPDFLRVLEGLEVYEDHDPDEEQAKYPVRRVGDLVGAVAPGSVRAVREGAEVQVRADVLVVSDEWRRTLLNAREADLLDKFQFSINANGRAPRRSIGGREVAVVEALSEIRSFDLVTKASAGGRFLRLLEAATAQEQEESDEMTTDTLAAQLRELLPDILGELGMQPAVEVEESEGAEPEAEEVEEVEPREDEGTVSEAQRLLRQLRTETQALKTERLIEARLAQANLPPAIESLARGRLVDLAKRRSVPEAEIDAVIKEHQTAAAQFVARSATGIGRIVETQNGKEIFAKRMEATLLGQRHQRIVEAAPGEQSSYTVKPVTDADGRAIAPFTSLREAYCQMHPDQDPWAGDLGERVWYAIADAPSYHSTRRHQRITEAITTATFGEVVQSATYNTLLRHYEALPYDDWRQLCSEVGPATDFRTKHYTRVGGYAEDLPIVGENEAYQPLTSPSDEEVTLSIAKRGGLEETITLEMVANDNLGALQRIPQRLAEQAKRTLYKFVMSDLILANPTLGYDSTTLFHATHSNTNTLAPSVSALDQVWRAMELQAPRLGSADILGPMNRPKFILGHRNLQGVWQRILNPSDAYAYGLTPAATTPGATIDTDANLDPHMWKGSGISFVPYWFSAATTNWVAIADPNAVDTVIVNFFAGREEPELFIQDDPRAGIGFAKDAQAMKVRHIYGGTTVLHTSFYRGNS